MTTILDGKQLADKITKELKEKTAALTTKPKLAVIVAGDNPASRLYVKNKQIRAEEIGFESVVIPLPENISEENLLEHIYILNEDKDINAILMQLPLPEHINKQRVLEAIEPVKDVDGFTSYNFGKLALGYKPFAVPCTPKGIIRLLREYNIDLDGKQALVIGRSNIVGKPISLLLQQKNATVTMANSHTKNLKEIALNSDIIVSAVGKPEFINEEYVKEGAVIVDVGISRAEKGVCGDVDYASAKEKASYITPVPGGVGPMTIAMLMENTYELYNLQKSLII
jgi:methylenetetrahydrofolate dehydrogenase (NADP+)/methenyltetrahydrofolate cyclohydrolase